MKTPTVIEPATLGPEHVAELIGLDRLTVLRMVRLGRLPRPDVVLTQKLVRWRESTIRAWMAKGRSTDAGHS